MLLKPEIINKILNNDNSIKRARAILNNHWSSIYNQNPLMVNKMNIDDIKLAKTLLASNLIQSQINFKNYKSIHEFIIKNDKFIENSAKEFLLMPFN
ncbi:hypothetical protein WR164_08070 [Philodulcilactobacillus myokoensis]|uniref:Uncharacterized protein n=1 Tax=Philodulcilactobacillus myokoensis TaxID=2929573 RepID=A0A9W6B1S5_9LACO|nr:hypothetical protein [Philodulcilactobacillus myokoensis]GLB46828.1 hypothetical protein WR164_08070 [Philodulcilactobacillus myokoensis]